MQKEPAVIGLAIHPRVRPEEILQLRLRQTTPKIETPCVHWSSSLRGTAIS